MQEIVALLNKLFTKAEPLGWESAIVYVECTEYRRGLNFYITVADSNIDQSDELNGCSVTQDEYERMLAEVHDLIDPFWEECQKENPWSNCTIIMRADGTFTVDYDNTNLDDGSCEYREKWQNKYLK